MTVFGIDFTHNFAQYFLVFVRVSAFALSAPITNARTVPVRVRITFSVLLTLVITPLVLTSQSINLISVQGYLNVLQQVLIGVAIGFVFHMVFQILVLGGQVIAYQSGLGFANLMDPQSGVNMSMVSQIYMMSGLLLFLLQDGHLILIQALADSFQSFPIIDPNAMQFKFKLIAEFGGQMFKGAVSMALPAIVSLLTVNFTFAVMTRAAPQLNIFSIGFPITTMLGMAVMFLTFNVFMSHADRYFKIGFGLIKHSAGLP